MQTRGRSTAKEMAPSLVKSRERQTPEEGRGPESASVVRNRSERVESRRATALGRSTSATSDDDGKTFDTGDIEPGKSSKAVKFEKPGEFKYHCKVHGKTMSGTVVVKAKAK